MPLKKCKFCNCEFSKKMRICPNCGAPSSNEGKWLVFFCFAILAVVGMLLIGNKWLGTKEATQSSSFSLNLTPEQKKVVELFRMPIDDEAKDAFWSANDIFNVGVLDNGTGRDGYAEFVCIVLYEQGFRGKGVRVQIIDIAKLNADGKWVELGEAHCQ